MSEPVLTVSCINPPRYTGSSTSNPSYYGSLLSFFFAGELSFSPAGTNESSRFRVELLL